MLFSIDREVLLENLNVLAKGIPSKTPLNALKGIKINVLSDKIIMTTSNTNISIQTIISDKSLNIKSTGDIVVPGMFLIDIIKKVNTPKIEMALIEEKIFIIKTDRSEFKLNIFDYEDYPEIQFIEKNNPLKINSKVLSEIIKETIFTCSTSEKRPILTGVNFKINEDKITATATDSFRLSQKITYLDFKYDQKNIVIPASSLDELSKVIDNFNDILDIYFASNKVLFKFKNILFQTRLLEGNYPDTSKLIPSDFPMIIKFNREELLQALDRVSLLSPKDKDRNFNIISFNLREDKVVEITSKNTEIGNALEEISPLEIVGPRIKIAFSSRYLIEILKVYNSPEITLNFTGDIKPFIIKSELDKNLAHLILPVKID